MQEGLALKRIQTRVLGEEIVTVSQAARALKNLEPYERLEEALARRGDGPTPAEICAFVRSCGDKPSEEVQQFIILLKSLNEPAEEWEHKAARRKARALLRGFKDSYETVAYRFARQAEKVHSPQNLAALTAPQDKNALLMQRMEASNLRQLWRLTNTLIRIREGALTRKDVKNADRPGYVTENKGDNDIMTDTQSDSLSENTQVLQKKAAL